MVVSIFLIFSLISRFEVPYSDESKTGAYLDSVVQLFCTLFILASNFEMIFWNYKKYFTLIEIFHWVENKVEIFGKNKVALLENGHTTTKAIDSLRKKPALNVIEYEIVFCSVTWLIFTSSDFLLLEFKIAGMLIYLFAAFFFLLMILIINLVLFACYNFNSLNSNIFDVTRYLEMVDVRDVRLARKIYTSLSDLVYLINDIFGWPILFSMGLVLSASLNCANFILYAGTHYFYIVITSIFWSVFMLVSIFLIYLELL